MTNDGGPAVDSSREAVERMAHDCDGHAQWLRDRTPEGGTAGLAEIYGRIAATLRTLLAERDTLAAANATLAEEIEEITAIADRGVVLHGEAAEIMSSLEAQRDAATAERDRMRAALEKIDRLHIPDQPLHFDGDDLEWAQRHVGTLRGIARAALTSAKEAGDDK